MNTRPGTLEFAKYLIESTTRSSGSTADVLRSYCMRWQIERVFKRLKSLAQLGHVPKHDDRSSRAWLYGKLLVTLLAQKLIRIGRDISPSGYPLAEGHLARRVNSASRFIRSSKLSNRTSPCSKRSIRGTTSLRLWQKGGASDYFN
jgi:Transposase DDE domain